MTRKQFIESHGATCKNWNWSWSFINESERLVIFGAWDRYTNGKTALILSEDWRVTWRDQKSKGYDESRERIRLIEEEGYRLMTFPMQHSEDEEGPVKIAGFTPELTEKKLTRIGASWYAADSSAASTLAEELPTPEKYSEGARSTVTINAYERNPKARAACIAHHGHICAVCGFDFATVYGALGEGFIHVHHIVPIGKIGKQYEIDPIADLIPICPNCHAMIHRTEPPLTVEQLRKHLQETKKNT
jgi:5-methylcytosine-specific restriction enzyme A